MSDIEDYRREGQVIPIWKRTAVDRLRVAVSRATENLLFLDITSDPHERGATREFLKGLPKLLELDNAELEQLPRLVGEDWDVEDWLRECIRAAGEFVARDPLFAWKRAQHAFRFMGDPSALQTTPATADDTTLRHDVCLACAHGLACF